MKKETIIWLLTAALIISLGFNYFLSSKTNDRYPLLSKRIFAENQNDIVINFTGLRTELRQYMEHSPARSGVYFEYLPSGVSIGVNEKEVFFTASLIKLPTVMRTYYLISQGKISEGQTVTLAESQIDKGYGDLWQNGAGATVTVTDLIAKTLRDSDNTAFRALQDLIEPFNTNQGDKHSLQDVYNYLDIPEDDAGGNAGITPKNFSSVLRSLYLSAYLPYELSEKILGQLTESTFNDWLPEPLPEEIKVAHKFGLYDAKPYQYAVHSDCGIIYVPKRPYLLCVMVNTPDGEVAKQEIRAISKAVYDYVTKVSEP